jgi:hypothetical protein
MASRARELQRDLQKLFKFTGANGSREKILDRITPQLFIRLSACAIPFFGRGIALWRSDWLDQRCRLFGAIAGSLDICRCGKRDTHPAPLERFRFAEQPDIRARHA